MTDLLSFYNMAYDLVNKRGYSKEIKWQSRLDFNNFTETSFLQELAWVILCSGFNEKVVRKNFDYISLCFYDWLSPLDIIDNSETCIDTAYMAFSNRKKLVAIVDGAFKISNCDFEVLKSQIHQSPIEKLQSFDFIGPITAQHLAKNLGLPIAKEDRHLIKLSSLLGRENVQAMCLELADYTGHEIQVVDIVLWRFMTLEDKDLYLDRYIAA